MPWWDPISWWKPIDNAWHTVDKDVRNLVKHAIKEAVAAVEQDISDVGTWANQGLSILGDGVNYAESIGTQALDGVEHIWNVDLPAWSNDAKNFAQQGLNDLQNWTADAVNGAEQAANDALGAAETGLHYFVTDLVDPALSWISQADAWVLRHLDTYWHDIYRDVVHPIEDGLGTAEGWIKKADSYLYHDVMDAVHLVEGAGHWLAFFADHPSKVVEDVVGTWTKSLSLSDLIHQGISFMDRSDKSIEDEVRRLL